MSDDTGVKQSQFGLYAQDQIKLGRLSFNSVAADFVTTRSTAASSIRPLEDASAFTAAPR